MNVIFRHRFAVALSVGAAAGVGGGVWLKGRRGLPFPSQRLLVCHAAEQNPTPSAPTPECPPKKVAGPKIFPVCEELASNIAALTESCWELSNSPPQSMKKVEGISPGKDMLLGKWETIWDRSTPWEDVMYALGVSWWKRQAMKFASPRNQIEAVDEPGGALKVLLLLPLGFTKSFTCFLDGRVWQYPDYDTGNWDVRSHLVDGVLILRRKRISDEAMSVETRCVFENDPAGIEKGPVQLMQVRVRMAPGEKELVTTRWMRKLT